MAYGMKYHLMKNGKVEYRKKPRDPDNVIKSAETIGELVNHYAICVDGVHCLLDDRHWDMVVDEMHHANGIDHRLFGCCWTDEGLMFVVEYDGGWKLL